VGFKLILLSGVREREAMFAGGASAIRAQPSVGLNAAKSRMSARRLSVTAAAMFQTSQSPRVKLERVADAFKKQSQHSFHDIREQHAVEALMKISLSQSQKDEKKSKANGGSSTRLDVLRLFLMENDDRKLLFVNQWLLMGVFLSVVLAVMTSEVCFDAPTKRYLPADECSLGLTMGVANFLVSLVVTVGISKVYSLHAGQARRMFHLESDWQAFVTTRMYVWYIAELIICVLIQPHPFIDWKSLESAQSLVVFMMVSRSYQIFRTAKEYTTVWRLRHRYQQIGTFNVFKIQFATRGPIVLIVAATLFCLALSYMIFLAEREILLDSVSSNWLRSTNFQSSQEREGWFETDFFFFRNSLWFAVVTLTAVGYGEYAPVTKMGRLLSFVTMVGGLVICSLIVAVFDQRVTPKFSQSNLISWTQIELMKRKRLLMAVQTLQLYRRKRIYTRLTRQQQDSYLLPCSSRTRSALQNSAEFRMRTAEWMEKMMTLSMKLRAEEEYLYGQLALSRRMLKMDSQGAHSLHLGLWFTRMTSPTFMRDLSEKVFKRRGDIYFQLTSRSVLTDVSKEMHVHEHQKSFFFLVREFQGTWLAVCCSVVACISTAIRSELCWDHNSLIFISNADCQVSKVAKYVDVIVSIVIFFALIRYYYTRVMYMMETEHKSSSFWAVCWAMGYFKLFCVDVLFAVILASGPPMSLMPLFYDHTLSIFCSAFRFLYLSARLYRLHSSVVRQRFRFCSIHNISVDIHFLDTIKLLFKDFGFMFVFLVFCFSVGVLAYCFHLAERGFWVCFNHFGDRITIPAAEVLANSWDGVRSPTGKCGPDLSLNCAFGISKLDVSYYCQESPLVGMEAAIWYTAQTMLTVGYGDVVAESDLGKLYSAIMLAAGVAIGALLLAEIVNKLKLTVNERAVLMWVSAHKIEDKRIRTALDMLTQFVKFNRAAKAMGISWREYYAQHAPPKERYQYVSNFRNLKQYELQYSHIFHDVMGM